MTADIPEDDNQNIRKKTRNDRNLTPADDIAMDDGPISGPSMDRPTPVKLDHLLMHELSSCKRKKIKQSF